MVTTSLNPSRLALLLLIAGMLVFKANVSAASEDDAVATPEMLRQLTILHADASRSAYCGCEFSVHTMADSGSCRLSPPDNASAEIEWTTLISKRHLEDIAQCSDIECNDALNSAFQDLQLWVPMRRDVADRLANLRLGATQRATSSVCGVSIDEKQGVFTPAPVHLGRIARVLLYLQQYFDLAFDSTFNRLLSKWHLDNPPTLTEVELNRWLTVVQGKGVSTSRVSIETYIEELEQRQTAFDLIGRIEDLREDVIEKINATNNAADPADSFRLARFYTSSYVNMSADLHAYKIMQGDESGWQSMFDGLEMHWLASQKSQYKVGDPEVYGKMMSLAVIAGENAKAKEYASAYLRPYNQYRIENYIYENRYPDLIRAIALLVQDEAWPTDLEAALAGHPYGHMLEAGSDNAMFEAALYDSGNYFLDMDGVIQPYFRLTPFEFLAIVELRNSILGTESPRLAHPMFDTKLAAVPPYTRSNNDPILTLMNREWGEIEPVPELIEIIVDKEFGEFKVALDEGASPSAQDHLGRTPLTVAAELNLNEFVSELIARGAETGGVAGRALHSALGHRNYEMSRVLSEAGVDVNYVWRPETGPVTSAVREASTNPSAEIIELLFKHGLDFDSERGIVLFADTLFRTTSPDELRGILDVLIKNGLNIADAAPFCREGALQASAADMNYLIDKGADVNKRFYSESTPLICAAQYGSLTAIKVLLERGADIRAKNRYGDSALDTARQYGHDDIAQFLLSYRR